MAGIVVKPRARILHGHDWVFSSEVLKVFGNPADGDVISLKDGRDHLIGSAIYNSKSQIVARRFSRRRQDLDPDFFRRRIAQASEYRDRRNIDPEIAPRSVERKRRPARRDHRSLWGSFRFANAHAGDGHAKGFDHGCDGRFVRRHRHHRAKRCAGAQSGGTGTAQWSVARNSVASPDRNRRREGRN